MTLEELQCFCMKFDVCDECPLYEESISWNGIDTIRCYLNNGPEFWNIAKIKEKIQLVGNPAPYDVG
jgi:hypothetical protein